MRLLLAEAGFPATESEIRGYARERERIVLTVNRMYEPPFDDRYAGPIQKPVLSGGSV